MKWEKRESATIVLCTLPKAIKFFKTDCFHFQLNFFHIFYLKKKKKKVEELGEKCIFMNFTSFRFYSTLKCCKLVRMRPYIVCVCLCVFSSSIFVVVADIKEKIKLWHKYFSSSNCHSDFTLKFVLSTLWQVWIRKIRGTYMIFYLNCIELNIDCCNNDKEWHTKVIIFYGWKWRLLAHHEQLRIP